MAIQITNTSPANGDTAVALGGTSPNFTVTCTGTVDQTPTGAMEAQLSPYQGGPIFMPTAATSGTVNTPWSFTFTGVAQGMTYNLSVWAPGADGMGCSIISFTTAGPGGPLAPKPGHGKANAGAGGRKPPKSPGAH